MVRVTLISLLSVLSACSTYPSKFRCGDTKGLGCSMLAEVDHQIASGQIEEIYKKSADKNCGFGNCAGKAGNGNNPEVERARFNKAKIGKEDLPSEYESGGYWYFK